MATNASSIAADIFWSVETETNIHASTMTLPLPDLIAAAAIMELAIGKLRTVISQRIGVTNQ